MTADELAALLRPVDFTGRETVRFRSDGFTSALTRELLAIRLRRQAEVFETGTEPVATRFFEHAIEVDAAAMLAANAIVTARLAELAGPIRSMRKLDRTARAVAHSATAFEIALADGRPRAAALLAHIDVDTAFQALGALRFCLPGDLRARVDRLAPGEADTLLASEEPSLWIGVRLRELALARARHRHPERYARLRSGFRRSVGYLGGEDIDFEAGEQDDAIDARVAACGDLPAIAAAVAAIADARRTDRARRRNAAARFTASQPDAPLVALVLLARALAAHEDRNRRAKMRLLRNLRDVARMAGFDLSQVTLMELLGSCG